jgi:hypothetical protein
MFFTLSKHPDLRFPYHDTMGTFVFSHDAGWHRHQESWFKGYRDNEGGGNWAEISWNQSCVTLQHGPCRSFPLWWDKQTNVLTNLVGHGESVWANHRITLDEHGLNTVIDDSIHIVSATPEIGLDCAAGLICDRLVKKTRVLLDINSDIPKRLFLTGGIDTLLLYSLLKHVGIDVELLDYEYIKYDQFLNNNLHYLKKQHWGYRQIHHWDHPTIFVTGGCGDEFMFRGPATVSLWAAWHDINLNQVLTRSHGYHVGYFRKEKNLKIFVNDWDSRDLIKNRLPSKQALISQILDINANDHQHWHIGETITWTPFLDLELTKIVLSMDQNSIMRQVIDAELNRLIIKKLHEPAIRLLSDTKNDNSRARLHLISTF